MRSIYVHELGLFGARPEIVRRDRQVGLSTAWSITLALSVPSGGASDFVGPFRCTICHAHSRPAAKWQREEPAVLKERAHFNSLAALSSRKAPAFARAVGLPNPLARNGACVSCHATPFGQRALAGISCESCHGAASGYLVSHQVRGARERAIVEGMRPLRGNPGEVSLLCASCHAIRDRRLLAAGHPAGRSFQLAVALYRIVHWGFGASPAVADEWDLSKFRLLPRDFGMSQARTMPPPARPSPEEGFSSVPSHELVLPASQATELRWEALKLIARLIAGGSRLPQLSPPAPPAEFVGPDSELHRIQEEALILAMEALREAKRP